MGEAGTKRACEIGPQADLALVLDTSENMALGQGGVITGWITVKSKNTIHDGARSQTIHAGGGLFGASAIEKMTKIIQALNELEQHWAVMKHSPGMPPGANTINPAVIEGDVILLLLLMNVVYGLRFIIYLMKVMTTLQKR